MTLRPVVPGRIWHAQHLLRFGPVRLATRMTVVRLQAGGLWVHSPIPLTQDLARALDAIDVVNSVVAPNRSHHLFFRPFLEAYSGARGWIAPGLPGKRPDLAAFPVLRNDEPWCDELAPCFIRGLPLLNETVWFHGETGMLILTDLLFCVGRNTDLVTRSIARLLGVDDRLGMSRTLKFAVRDRAALAESVRPLLALPVERVIVAHDRIVSVDARSALRRAFEWLC